VVVDLSGLLEREVHASVGSVVSINIAAEALAPACVVDTAASVEAHPVINE
jgi:hypothetical protein